MTNATWVGQRIHPHQLASSNKQHYQDWIILLALKYEHGYQDQDQPIMSTHNI